MTRDEEWLLKEKWNGEKAEGFFADAARLRLNEPLAYVIGSIPFLDTTIHLDSHPLIPRTETEYWVEDIIKRIKRRATNETIRVLDLCAGSGCIGVALLKALPNTLVDFAEIDHMHHITIQKNIIVNGIDPERTHIYGGDLFSEIKGQYEYILSNPPYIDPEIDRTEASVKAFEPNIALYGGKKGIEVLHRIIADASKFLTHDGSLVIEHEPEQELEIRTLAEKYNYLVSSLPDQFGVIRYTILVRNI